MPATPTTPATEGWQVFFSPGKRVVALPSWEHPRLLLSADTLRERMCGSAFYPGFRLRGKLYRWLMRGRAIAAVNAGRVVAGGRPLLGEFLQDVLPGARVRAVLVGIPGPPCKLTAQLVDQAGRVVAYMKCAHYALARQRLRHEHELLRQLPPGVGPTPIKYGSFAGRDVLLLDALSGTTPKVTATPPPALRHFCSSLLGTRSYSLVSHPWVRQHVREDGECGSLLEALGRRDWPVAIQHGDLAPWNLIEDGSGEVAAVDWEYGSNAGFPGLDLAQYVLQVAALVKRSKPAIAREFAIDELEKDETLALSRQEAAALVTLAAGQAFHHGAEDGRSPNFWVQAWRKAVFEQGARCAG